MTERDGNLPERHVYEVSSKGEAYFQDGVLKELAHDATADQPGIAVLNYLEELDPAAAADQLQQRRDQVAARETELANVPEEVRYLHPAFDLGLRLAAVELEWLDEKIHQLRKQRRSVA